MTEAPSALPPDPTNPATPAVRTGEVSAKDHSAAAERRHGSAPPHGAPYRARRRQRRRWLLGAALMLGGAAGALFSAERAAHWIEARTTRAVAAALADAGFDWAAPSADGLRLTLTGQAPDEVARVRALAAAARAAGPDRVIDAMEIAPRPGPTGAADAASAPATLPAPPVQVELLRNGTALSVAGTLPEGADRQAILDHLARAVPGAKISDLLQQTPAPAPDGWDAALSYALTATALAAQAKLSVTPGHVTFAAITDGESEKTRLTTALNRDRPAKVALDARIDAPRPVIAPFVLRATRADGATRLEACSADSAEMADALRLAAGPGPADCRLGLGVPGPDWPEVAIAGLRALNTLTAGTLALIDQELTLTAPADVDGAVFDAAMASLRAALPPGYRLNATRAAPKAAPDSAAADFTATLADGRVALSGRVAGAPMRDALGGLAAARLGPVDDTLAVDPALPADWTARQIALVEAMGGMAQGSGALSPSLIRLTGVSGDPQAGEIAVARLSHRLGAGHRYAVQIDYDPGRDPAKAPPPAAQCVDRLNAAMAEPGIVFAANSTEIPDTARPMLAKVAELLDGCAMWRLEIGGHTDSQGRDALNLQLSQGRAEAVRAALAADGAPVAHVTAKGWGDTRPRADNATEDGRAANRRIEFTVTDPDPVALPVQRGPLLEGVTQDGVPEPPATETATPRLPPLPSVAPDNAAPPASASDSDAPSADAPKAAAGTAPKTGTETDTKADTETEVGS